MILAWYDPTNHHVSTDKHDPLFTPLGQIWPLHRMPSPLTDEKIYECYRIEFDILLTDSGAQNTIKRFAKAVERAHGIGEKK